MEKSINIPKESYPIETKSLPNEYPRRYDHNDIKNITNGEIEPLKFTEN